MGNVECCGGRNDDGVDYADDADPSVSMSEINDFKQTLKDETMNMDEVESSSEDEENDEGFASAIAGIFDGLEGDDALLSEYPEVKFFVDDSLENGDCQIKSRFGLLDGRIATKLRKIEEELLGND